MKWDVMTVSFLNAALQLFEIPVSNRVQVGKYKIFYQSVKLYEQDFFSYLSFFYVFFFKECSRKYFLKSFYTSVTRGLINVCR